MSLSPVDSSSSPPAAAAAEVPLAPGFRFHPTDEELVSYYLRRRVLGRRLRVDAIAEVDLYRLEPWDLPSLSRIRSRDAQWYFFAHLDRKVAGAGAGGRGGPGNRTNRATPRGYWKTTGKDREVHHRGKLVGMKKTLVFHAGRAPKGERTNWVMHEYRLLDADGPQDLHVVCRIFQKHGSGPQNGAQYGAPYMEEEWEEDDDAIENGPTSGASAQMAAITSAVDEESNEDDENAYCETNRPARVEPSHLPMVHEMFNPPEMAPLQGQDSKETSDVSCADGAISLEEILQEPLSNISVENIGRLEGQNATDNNVNVDEFLSAYPRKDNGYVGQDNTMNGSGPADGDHTSWPLRAYSNQNYVNGPLADEFFDTGNDTNGVAYAGHQQADGFPAPHQVDDSMVFYDAPSDYNLVDGNDDFVYLNDLLNEPLGNESLFDGDDMMAYFDATENDFKYDILGSAQGSNYQLADMPLNFAQKSDTKFTCNGISEVPESNAQYSASSSGSHENLYTDTEFPGVPTDDTADNLYTDTEFPGVPTDDTADKTYGKRLASMLGSIPAPPAMASEFPPSTGKSVGVLSAVSSSSIRVTAGIIQLDGLAISSGSDRWPLQKNEDLSLLVTFAVESDIASKLPVGLEHATRISTVPMVLRSGFYLFFMSAMILLLSYKVGSCVYSR